MKTKCNGLTVHTNLALVELKAYQANVTATELTGRTV